MRTVATNFIQPYAVSFPMKRIRFSGGASTGSSSHLHKTPQNTMRHSWAHACTCRTTQLHAAVDTMHCTAQPCALVCVSLPSCIGEFVFIKSAACQRVTECVRAHGAYRKTQQEDTTGPPQLDTEIKLTHVNGGPGGLVHCRGTPTGFLMRLCVLHIVSALVVTLLLAYFLLLAALL